MGWLSKREQRKRKKEWEEASTDLDRVNISLLSFEFELPEIDINIGSNLNLGFNFEFDLTLNWHFEIPPLDAITPFWDEIKLELPPILFQPFTELLDEYGLPKIEKARYGISKYGLSYYDPPELTSDLIRRCVFDLSKRLTEWVRPYPKLYAESGRRLAEFYKNLLVKKGVRDFYAEGITKTILSGEGKTAWAYTGFAIVGVSKVLPAPRHSKYPYTIYYERDPQDFKTLKEFRTVNYYECHVGRARVNYSRVSKSLLDKSSKSKSESNPAEIRFDEFIKTSSDVLGERISWFRKRTGHTPIAEGLDVLVPPKVREVTKLIPTPRETMFQRIHYTKTRHKRRKRGAPHQARLDSLIRGVKEILDERGIIGVQRLGYISFAEEILYKDYEGSKKIKQWKKILSDDDLIDKGVLMGLDREILKQIIKEVVEVLRPALT